MKHQVQALGLDVDELAVPDDIADRQPDQRRGSRVVGLQNADRPQLDTDDRQAVGALAKEVDERLNLGKLGHSPILAQQVPSQKALHESMIRGPAPDRLSSNADDRPELTQETVAVGRATYRHVPTHPRGELLDGHRYAV